MLTGEIRSQVDRIWDAFWSGGISNPLEVIEQITYLLFLRRLDEMQTLEENKANRLGNPIERAVYPARNDPQGRPYADRRWSRFKNLAPADMFALVDGVRAFTATHGSSSGGAWPVSAGDPARWACLVDVFRVPGTS